MRAPVVEGLGRRRRAPAWSLGPVASVLVVPALVVAALVVAGCSSGSSSTGPGGERGSPPTGPSTVTAASLCADAVAATVPHTVAGLTEASGLASSRSHPEVLWSHDDSGGPAEVVALTTAGADAGRVALTGADAVDWEDIALLPGGEGVPDRLVVGDIGDNPGSVVRATRPPRILVVEELAPPGPGGRAASAPVVAVSVSYPDGPRDAETVLADPRTGEVLVVSKQWDGEAAGLYRLPGSALLGPDGPAPVVMERAGTVAGTTGSLVTGGDVSPDGGLVALRTYADVRLWERGADETVGDALGRPPACRIGVAEPQGEAVAFTADGRGLITVSEGVDQPLHVRRLP